MPTGELVFRSNVEYGRSSAGGRAVRDRFELVASPEIARRHARDFGAVALADAAQSGEQTHHHFVANEAIVNALAGTAALDKRSAAEKLQMSGCVGKGEARAGRQLLDAALALSEMFEQFEPMRMGERVSDLRETCKNLLFRPCP